MADLPEETENVVLEYQHQCELNQQGLHMVLQLYQEAFPNTQVSIHSGIFRRKRVKIYHLRE